MKNFIKFLSIFVLLQTANASDPIDHFRAGTLRVNLIPGFTQDDAFSVLSRTLREVPEKKFTISGFADDSWRNPGRKGVLDSWLQSLPQWDQASFLKLCDFAFGINSSKKNEVSYDAVIYLKAFMQQHFSGQISEESKALDFAEHVLDSSCEKNSPMFLLLARDISCSVDVATHSMPFFHFENIHPLQQNFPGFLRSLLFFYSNSKNDSAKASIGMVWVHHYLEQYFGHSRSEIVFKSAPYINLELALYSGYNLLGFNAERAPNPYNALVAHYDYLRTKGWCSAERFYNWGDLLVSKKSQIGLEGKLLSDSQKIRECAHYLFRCAWELPKARVLLAESITYGVMLDEKGRMIDNRQNPNAYFEHAARILRDFLTMQRQENWLRAKAFDKLALLVYSNMIHVDEKNKPLASLAERTAFCRRAWKFTLTNTNREKIKYLAGLKLLKTYMGTDVSDFDARELCGLLAPLYNINPFAKSEFLLTFGQLVMEGKWSKKEDGSVLHEADRARYAFECFAGALAELNKLTSDFDKLNTSAYRSFSQHNMARVLVKHPELFPGEIQGVEARMEYINELLKIPTKPGLLASFSQEQFNLLFNSHVVRGLAFLNIASDQGKAVEEFRIGALKGEHSAYAYYIYHAGLPSEAFFDDESSDEDEVFAEDVASVSLVAGADSLRVRQAEEDQMGQEREERAAFLALQDVRQRLAGEQEEKAKRNEAIRIEKDRIRQQKIAEKVKMPLAPVTQETKTWEIVHLGKCGQECADLESNPAEKFRYMTLLNAIQLDDKTGKPETLTGVCLTDGTPILTRRFSLKDRMVYSLLNKGTNPVLTFYGFNGHDDTVAEMLRAGIAKRK